MFGLPLYSRMQLGFCPLLFPKMNAFVERFNRTIQEQFINWNLRRLRDDIDHFNRDLIDWLLWYNTKRRRDPNKRYNDIRRLHCYCSCRDRPISQPTFVQYHSCCGSWRYTGYRYYYDYVYSCRHLHHQCQLYWWNWYSYGQLHVDCYCRVQLFSRLESN